MKKWVEELQANGPKDIVLAVVGNKIDRCDEEEVDYANVKEYASSLGAILKLVSAKEGKNIDVSFMVIQGLVQYCRRDGGKEKRRRADDHRRAEGDWQEGQEEEIWLLLINLSI